MDGIYTAQIKYKRRAFVKTKMKFLVPYNARNE
jgi:hypothetical protein